MKYLTIFLLLGLYLSTNAQTKYFERDIEGLRSDLREEAKKIFAENMILTPEEAKVFWPLYDEYRATMKPFGDREVEITELYMLDYYAMDDSVASKLLDDITKLDSDKRAVQNEYIKKMKKVLPAKVVGRFYQIEKRLNLMIDLEKASRVPILKSE
jgi:hypothetical protein